MPISSDTIGPPDFEPLLTSGRRLIDVRAPVEFLAGSLPEATNLPLLTDEERHQVGLTYRKLGQKSAIELGHQLVGGDVKAARVAAWANEVKKHPDAVLFCFRGGLRSQISQQWLREVGLNCPIVKGGYKALRRFAIEFFERRVREFNFLIVGGPTGSGKTEYLQQSGRPFIDLERLAAHRGSAFGATEAPQPTQINFENALAVELLKVAKQPGPILLENESQMIGRCTIPQSLFEKMRSSPKTVLSLPFEERVENIFRTYVVNSKLGQRGEAGRFQEFETSVLAISKKLGGLRTKEILADLAHARLEFAERGALGSNRVWISKILAWYYDPLYRKSAGQE